MPEKEHTESENGDTGGKPEDIPTTAQTPKVEADGSINDTKGAKQYLRWAYNALAYVIPPPIKRWWVRLEAPNGETRDIPVATQIGDDVQQGRALMGFTISVGYRDIFGRPQFGGECLEYDFTRDRFVLCPMRFIEAPKPQNKPQKQN